MDNVGESLNRNRDFERKFTRELLIKNLVGPLVAAPVILDVGAHKGESVRFLRKLFPAALIHSFEPAPEPFAELQRLADPRTHCHNLALTDVDGTVTFYANAISHTNSVFRVNTASADSLFLAEQRRSGTTVPAEVFNRPLQAPSARLSSFCRQQGIERVDLLKLDVQGAERRVLEGAQALLPRIDNIVLEIMFFDYYEHQGSFLEIESVLHPAGFRLFSISELSNNPMNGRTDWAEVIYRRTAQR